MGAQRAKVWIVGTQQPLAGVPDSTEQTFSGLYSFQNGKHFVLYEEDEEGHITHNTIKVSADSFEVIKKGASCVRMVFRAGERCQAWYETPYGRLPVALDVKEVEIRRPETGRVVLLARAVYVLELAGEPVSENQTLIRVSVISERE